MIDLELIGHDDRYAVEQLCLSLFGVEAQVQAVSRLYRGKTWLTAVTTLTVGQNKTRGVRRLPADAETVQIGRASCRERV